MEWKQGKQWNVTVQVFAFDSEEEAKSFRDAFMEAFCAMPEAAPYAASWRVGAISQDEKRQMEWQPIETAPKDVLHVRGMWVHSAETGERMYWAADAGYVDEDGDFRLSSDDESGWRADDYTHWMPLPPPPQD